MFTLSCLVLTVIVCLIYYRRRNKDYWRKRNVAQVDGVTQNFLSGNRSLAELHKEIYDRYPHEKYVGIIWGSRPAVILKDVDDISFVHKAGFHNFHSRGFVINPKDILSDNLMFISDYQRWRLLRQSISPIFTQMKLKKMFCNIERCASDFVRFMEENVQIRNTPFNALYTYTTASIAASVFGIDTKSQTTMDCPFMDMIWSIFEPSIIDNFKFVLANYSPWLFRTLNLKIFGKHEKFFVGFMKEVLESRKNSKEVRCYYDFIDTCLELQQNGMIKDTRTGYKLDPTDDVLAAQAFLFFVAGADPSASTMNYILLELSNNKSILKRLHMELDKIFDNCNGNVTYETIDHCYYLDMLINESLRKYPTIGGLQRKCTVNTVLPSGLHIKENTIILVPIFALHRDEKYYPNPERYDPERFASDSISKIKKYTYLPFGEGIRGCLGQRFARLQMKIGLAYLLRRFTLKEQHYRTTNFAKSVFFIRDPKATYELVRRDHF